MDFDFFAELFRTLSMDDNCTEQGSSLSQQMNNEEPATNEEVFRQHNLRDFYAHRKTAENEPELSR